MGDTETWEGLQWLQWWGKGRGESRVPVCPERACLCPPGLGRMAQKKEGGRLAGMVVARPAAVFPRI